MIGFVRCTHASSKLFVKLRLLQRHLQYAQCYVHRCESEPESTSMPSVPPFLESLARCS